MHELYTTPPKLDFNDVLIRPAKSYVLSRSLVDTNSVTVSNALGILTNGIVAANMDGVGTVEIARILRKYNVMTALSKHYSLEDLYDHFESEESSHSFYSLGMSANDLEKYTTFINVLNPKKHFKICIDVANGYMSSYGEYCKKVKELYPNVTIMAGNVVCDVGVENLGEAVDIAKLGIGSGSNCLTRTQTGIGYPQLSCIIDITDTDKLLCSDGGCVSPGDIAKAFVAGADLVMLGGMLAGTDEGGGTVIEINGKKFVEFYGMSSLTAQHKHNGGVRNYRASEGRTTLIPYKGKMADVIGEILNCLQSTCTYTGSLTLDELKIKGSLHRVNNVINRSMEHFTTGI